MADDERLDTEEELREKRDQELMELLNEIRVGLSGASVLFGFLLIVPFSAAWEKTTRDMKAAYVVSFLTTLIAVVALMAPTVYHRLRWRERNKERMLRAANLSTIVGMTALAVAMTAGVYLVIDAVVSQGWAIAMTLAATVVFAGLWLVVPLTGRYDRWDDHLDEGGLPPEDPAGP
jgi:hypothetical protein